MFSELTNITASDSGQPAGERKDLEELKGRVRRRLLETMDMGEARHLPLDQLHNECSQRANALLRELRAALTAAEKQRLVQEVMDEIFGLGPLEELMRCPDVSDILVNGAKHIYIERNGRMEHADAAFRDDEHLLQVIHRIAAGVGRRIDESSPMLDARLRDGSRVNAIIPPLAIDGPCMSIRRFGTVGLDQEELIRLETLTPEMAHFLEAAVRARMNILISGGTGAGKTTLLNVLSRAIPANERVITIEDAAELRLPREHVVRLETRPTNVEGRGEVTQRDLLRNALRMRPDRIIIGEVRGAEALDMLQAMNTGHEGSMATVHANNPRDATRRIENMVSMSGINYPVHVIRQHMASVFDLVIHLDRLSDGRRKLISIAEVTGSEGDQICLQELFVFRQTDVDPEGRTRGRFETCGVRPRLLNRLAAEGITLPPDLFHHRVIGQTS